MALSFVTIYSIGRTRTGAAVAVNKILESITFSDLGVIVLIVIIAGVFAFFIGLKLSKVFATNINRVGYRKISFSIIILLVIVNLVLSNPLGVLVLVTGSALGVFAILSRVRRINLMGVLLIPTILFYLT